MCTYPRGYRWAGTETMKHIFAFRAPLKRHDSEANFKLKKEKKKHCQKTNTTKLLPGRIPIEIMSRENFWCEQTFTDNVRHCDYEMKTQNNGWEKNNNNQKNLKFSYCYWSYLSSLFHLLCCWSLIDLMGRKGGQVWAGPLILKCVWAWTAISKVRTGRRRWRVMCSPRLSRRRDAANASTYRVVILRVK